MQNIKNQNVLNLKPVIVISHEGLEAIKHIVSLAPQEAQWFHTVEPVEYLGDATGEIYLQLSTKLYIPKQNTSAAQVDTTSSMMIDFYNELKKDYKDQDIVNQKLSSMTCWCHSHVNMNPSPSMQDNKQFNSFIKSSEQQNLDAWQIMLIFNKKDQFYSRIYDPQTGLIFEGIDIIVQNDYDFSYIDKAAKTKFVKPKIKSFNVFKKNKFNVSPIQNNYLEDRLFNSLNEFSNSSLHYKNDLPFQEMASNIVDDIYYSYYPDTSNSHQRNVLPKDFTSYNVFEDIECVLDDKEILWLSYLCKGKEENIKNVFSEKQIKNYLNKYPQKPKQNICNYLENSNETLSDFKDKIIKIIKINNCATAKQLKDIF